MATRSQIVKRKFAHGYNPPYHENNYLPEIKGVIDTAGARPLPGVIWWPWVTSHRHQEVLFHARKSAGSTRYNAYLST